MSNQEMILFIHKCYNCGWEFVANTTINICPECDVEMINPVKDELIAVVNRNVK